MKSLYLVFILCLLFTSCTKEQTNETATTGKVEESMESQNLLSKQTWQIEEVIDPYAGVRFKRGVISDGKEFWLAQYKYTANGSITGNDWFGKVLVNNKYVLQEGGKKIKIITPDCTVINDIILLTQDKFSYKTIDGSQFILGPVQGSKSGF